MKLHAVLVVLIPGLVIAAFLAAIPLRTASAQICYDAQHPNGFPCPEEKRKKPTVIYPSFTPTATSTPTATPIPSSTPTSTPIPIPTSTPNPVLWIFASGPGPSIGPGGFNCPPYVGSVPLGAGIMAGGLLILAIRARILSTRFPPGMHLPASETDGSRLLFIENAPVDQDLPHASVEEGVAFTPSRQPATLAEQDGSGSMFATMMAYLKMVMKEAREDRNLARAEKELELGARGEKLGLDNASIEQGMAEAGEKADQAMDAATTSMVMGIASIGAAVMAGLGFGGVPNQGVGATASGLAGTGVAGTGAGMLGSALFGGLLGFDCISTYVMLPSGAALGLIAGIAASLIPQSGR